MRLDDTVADGKSQPGSLADLLGGEERIEDPPQVLFRDAAAGIDDRDRSPSAWASTSCAGARGSRARPVRMVMFPFSSTACWALTSIFMTTCLIWSASIQIAGSVRSRSEHDLDIAKVRGLLDDAHRILDHLVEVGEFLFRRLFTSEIEQPLDDRRASLGFADHQVEVLRILAFVRHFLPQADAKRSGCR